MKTLGLFLLTALIFILQGDMLYDFKSSSQGDWFIVNDGVMGGLSKGKLEINDDGHAVFSGKVSLENNGGFTSIRRSMETTELDPKKTIAIRLKGDGKRYQFRFKEESSNYFSFIQYFETSGKWETIEIPLADFYPSFRGRKLEMDNFKGNQIEEMSFLIANYKEESFRLEIDWISLKSEI
jgi:hypothetical protein